MYVYHAHGVPVKVLQPVVIPGGDAPQAGVLLQQHSCCSEEVQEVWAEQHVILHNDRMTVLILQEGFVQSPLVVLGQPSMPWLHQNMLQNNERKVLRDKKLERNEQHVNLDDNHMAVLFLQESLV